MHALIKKTQNREKDLEDGPNIRPTPRYVQEYVDLCAHKFLR